MAILVKGVDFSTGQQVTAANLDNLVDLATFDTGAVDNASTQLSGGAIIVKDGGITSAKLDTNIAVAGTLSVGGLVTFSGTQSNGQGGTGSSVTILNLNGGSASNGGSYINFLRNSVSQVVIGTESSIIGNNSDALALFGGANDVKIWAGGAGNIATFSATGLLLSSLAGSGTRAVVADASGNLSTGTIAVASGGTGATDAATARTNLGLAIGMDVQAYDADLAALAALSGTNTIYYRSAANTWSAVTIGSNLTFSGGTLSASGGGGGTIGGSTGATDNRVLRADGTGGSTLQNSAVSIDDSGNVTGAATYDAGTGGYKVSGTKVIGAQQAAITNPSISPGLSGSDTIDLAAVSNDISVLSGKISDILAALRTHGMIAT